MGWRFLPDNSVAWRWLIYAATRFVIRAGASPDNLIFTRLELEPSRSPTSDLARASPMTILVTGGAGYIGSHMVHALVEAGEGVVVLDNLSTGFKWAIAKGVPLVTGETGDEALVTRLIAEHGVSS